MGQAEFLWAAVGGLAGAVAGAGLVFLGTGRGFYCPPIAGLIAGLGVRLCGARISFDLVVLAAFYSLVGMLAADVFLLATGPPPPLITRGTNVRDLLLRSFDSIKCVQYLTGILLACVTAVRMREE